MLYRQDDAPACLWIALAAHERTATNGLRFGGDEGTMTVATKMIAGSKWLNATLRIERMGLRVGFSFAKRESTFQPRTVSPCLGRRSPRRRGIDQPGGTYHAERMERTLGSPCATISDDSSTNALRAYGRFLARHHIALGSHRLFAGRRGARVKNTRCPGREFFGLAIFPVREAAVSHVLS
jgi:hypothetical protein